MTLIEALTLLQAAEDDPEFVLTVEQVFGIYDALRLSRTALSIPVTDTLNRSLAHHQSDVWGMFIQPYGSTGRIVAARRDQMSTVTPDDFLDDGLPL